MREKKRTVKGYLVFAGVILFSMGGAGCLEPEDVSEWEKEVVLSTDAPDNYTIKISNQGPANVWFTIELNSQKFFDSIDDVVDQIELMSEEYTDESMARKVWRFVRDNRYHYYPLTLNTSWFHNPAVFFNSAGLGFCHNAAAMCYHIWQKMGYETNLWALTGHVVSEVYRENKWEVYDADKEAYYYLNDDLDIASVEELAQNPQLISDPIEPVLDLSAHAYSSYVVECYSSTPNWIYSDHYDNSAKDDYDCIFVLPPGAILEFPAVFETPLMSCQNDGNYYEVEYYANLMLTIPSGWSGSVEIPLILHAIKGEGSVEVNEELYEIGSVELSQQFKERETFLYPLELQADDQIQLIYLVNPQLFKLDNVNYIRLEGFSKDESPVAVDVVLEYLFEEQRIGQSH